jgi:hypothetical protein
MTDKDGFLRHFQEELLPAVAADQEAARPQLTDRWTAPYRSWSQHVMQAPLDVDGRPYYPAARCVDRCHGDGKHSRD